MFLLFLYLCIFVCFCCVAVAFMRIALKRECDNLLSEIDENIKNEKLKQLKDQLSKLDDLRKTIRSDK